MVMIDVAHGEVYSLQLPDETERVLAEFVKQSRVGTVLLVQTRTGREIEIDIDEFESMRCDGRADRLSVDRDGQVIPHREIDPLTILDPSEPGITLRERDSRLKKQAELKKKRALRFYTMRYDKWERPTKGRAGVGKFIARVHKDAVLEGHDWLPSPSTVLRAVEECGAPNDRPLSAFFANSPEVKREKRWPKEVVTAASLAIEAYWDDSTFTIGDALAQFSLEAEGFAKARRVPLAGDASFEEPTDDGRPLFDRVDDFFTVHRLDPQDEQTKPKSGRKSPWPGVIPTVETVRLWLHANANWHTWASRYGIDNANRRFRGRGRALEAIRPLEYVLFDHTKLDVWSVVLDEDGFPLFVARAWLTFAIDLYSRMILGAVIGYEPPSIQSVTACLRQVVRKKEFLVREFGEYKGVADGWGKPSTIVVDNGKEFVSPSFQASCEAAGIDVIWAPVKTPTFKPHVERAYETFNTMLWHRLPGGLPLTPQQRQELGLEPEAKAAYTRPLLEDALWNTIATRYHVGVQKGIDMAPALKWARGMSMRLRPTVNKIEEIDKVIGRSKMVLLSAEGVTIEGNRFHDQALTTTLMNKLARFGKERQQRRSVTSSRTAWVRATWDPGDVARVHIWDPISRTSITLPNWDRRFSEGLSWYAAAKIREWSAERNQAFHSDAEKAAARVAHRKYLIEILPGAKSPQRSRAARLLEPRTELMPGNRVEVASVPPRNGQEIQHDAGIMRANRAMTVPKGRSFGGKAGAIKSATTRRRKKAAAEEARHDAQAVAPRPPGPIVAANLPKSNIDAIRARVAAKISKKG